MSFAMVPTSHLYTTANRFRLPNFAYLDTDSVYLSTITHGQTPDAIRQLLDELEANRRSRSVAG